ncbi:NAD(P)/FAD-dependent oxidoreductase [Streptomyces sp. NPDC051366]|uniref:NAD(P)/FAD-dependent oxidoreductase n=1 Tax=Streptomyces sp. NPDC051366 TaxID=3365652 RepID=UPI0037933E08
MTSPDLGADVLVAGAGPAGAATALALARSGADVVLVHPGTVPGWRVGESLAPTARPLLERLGILDRVTHGPHAPCYGSRSGWAGTELAASDSIRDPYGAGWHLDREQFDAALRDAARDAGVRHRTGSVARVTRVGHHWRAEVAAPRSAAPDVSAAYLVDATGARARIARHLGARQNHTDHLVAIAALLPVRPNTATEHTSLVEAASFGWWYTAPLACGRYVVMAVTDADLVGPAGLRTPDGWWSALQATRHIRTRPAAHGAARPQRLTTLRAGTSHLLPAGGPGWLAVGDAAITTDPIAARGITTALATGIAAADALADDAAGDDEALTRYTDLLALVHAEFLKARTACYRDGQRWGTPFWQRRTTP